MLKSAKKINIQHGKPEHVFNKILRKFDVEAVFCNEDYEPYAISRDARIKELCQEKGLDFHSFRGPPDFSQKKSNIKPRG